MAVSASWSRVADDVVSGLDRVLPWLRERHLLPVSQGVERIGSGDEE